jgi:hypothetical protein
MFENKAPRSPQGQLQQALWVASFLNFMGQLQLADIPNKLGRVGEGAETLSFRLTHSLWLMSLRHRFPHQPEWDDLEEKAFADVLVRFGAMPQSLPEALREVVEQMRYKRVGLFGPEKPSVVPVFLPATEAKLIMHQQAMLRLYTVAKTMPSDQHMAGPAWALIHFAWKIPPTPEMLEALDLLAKWVWWQYGVTPDAPSRFKAFEARNAFYKHYWSSPNLKESIFAGVEIAASQLPKLKH